MLLSTRFRLTTLIILLLRFPCRYAFLGESLIWSVESLSLNSARVLGYLIQYELEGRATLASGRLGDCNRLFH